MLTHLNLSGNTVSNPIRLELSVVSFCSFLFTTFVLSNIDSSLLLSSIDLSLLLSDIDVSLLFHY